MQVKGDTEQQAYSQTVLINHEYHYAHGLWSCGLVVVCSLCIPAYYNVLLGRSTLKWTRSLTDLEYSNRVTITLQFERTEVKQAS